MRTVSASGRVTTVAGGAGQYGDVDGTSAAARFFGPVGVVTPDGRRTVLAGLGRPPPMDACVGYADGPPAQAAVDRTGTVYVADPDNHAIRKIAPDGTTSTLLGGRGAWGSCLAPRPASRRRAGSRWSGPRCS